MQFKRFELKYFLNPVDTESLSQRLQAVLETDTYVKQEDGYRVRSLYFDSFDDECLYQKQSGLMIRKKIRLRTYGESQGDTIKFEIKHKQGAMVLKEAAVIDQNMAKQVCQGNWDVLLKPGHPVLNKIYALASTRLYCPKVIVEYIRMAYLFPAFNIRITFDKQLHSNINHLDLFSDQYDAMPTILEGKEIMEVKYEDYMPVFISRLLTSVPTQRSAISKYTLARRFHKHQKWEDN